MFFLGFGCRVFGKSWWLRVYFVLIAEFAKGLMDIPNAVWSREISRVKYEVMRRRKRRAAARYLRDALARGESIGTAQHMDDSKSQEIDFVDLDCDETLRGDVKQDHVDLVLVNDDDESDLNDTLDSGDFYGFKEEDVR